MSIIRDIKNRIVSKDKEIESRPAFSVFLIVFFLAQWCIQYGNGYSALWIFIPFGVCLAVAWWIGRTYMRMVIAVLVLALTIVMTFGFTGAQQTSEFMKTGGWSQGGEHKVNIRLEQQGETRTIQAQVTRSDANRLNPFDEVVCEYRTVSLFGWHLWTAIDSIESAPVIGAGSRNASGLLVWLTTLFGALPLGMLSGIIYFRRRFRRSDLLAGVAVTGDEGHENTDPVNNPTEASIEKKRFVRTITIGLFVVVAVFNVLLFTGAMPINYAFGAMFISIGLFHIVLVRYNWNRYRKDDRVKFMIRLLNESRARLLYDLIGVAIIAVGIVFAAGVFF